MPLTHVLLAVAILLVTVRIVALYVYVPVFTCVVSQIKLDWIKIGVVKKAWQYVQLFWYNRAYQCVTDRRPVPKTCINMADARNKWPGKKDLVKGTQKDNNYIREDFIHWIQQFHWLCIICTFAIRQLKEIKKPPEKFFLKFCDSESELAGVWTVEFLATLCSTSLQKNWNSFEEFIENGCDWTAIKTDEWKNAKIFPVAAWNYLKGKKWR